MTEPKDDSSFNPSSTGSSPDAKSEDQAALALKSSVLADAHDLTDGAKHLAGDAVAQARVSAQAQISGGKDRLAEGLGSVAEAIRHTGEQLREGEQSSLTDYVTKAADGVEAASDYLKEKSIGDVLGDMGSFARREPVMFLGGAFVLGLLGGRFLKSSHLKPSTPSGGRADSQSASRGTKQSNARRTGQGESSGKSPPRSPSALSGSKPVGGERAREGGSIGSAGGAGGAYRPNDDGAKLPGTL